MERPNIAIVIGTTRPTRLGAKPARWIHSIAAARSDMTTELVDLREYPLPFFDEAASNLWMPSKNEAAQRWQKKIAQFDGYIFVTAEYNHSIPAVLKNAFDQAYVEWNRKAAAFVGYGGVGAARAIEHLRGVCIELQMASTRNAVHIGGGDFMAVWKGGRDIAALTHLEKGAQDMLDELAWWASTLKAARGRDKPDAVLTDSREASLHR